MILADHINRKRLIETFTELIRINSPSFGEREIGDVLSRKLEAIGCRAEMQEYDGSFNLLAYKKGSDRTAPPLILSAHMDTIEPTEGIAFSIDNGLVRTTGATVLGADDKSAIAQILEALTVLEEQGIAHGDIEVVFSSGEEKGLFGARNLDLARLRGRHALVLDSSGSVGNLVVAAPTHITYGMQITGKPAHAGIEPEKGISAIRAAAEIISAVPDGRIDAETTANIGMIKGGTATNVVPKEVLINGELRGHNTDAIEGTRKKIFETARAIAEKNHARINIEEHEEYKAFRIGSENPFLKYLSGVFRKCSIEPVLVATGGGSDANIFNQRGITAVNISTGMQKVHSTEEYISIKDLVNGCLIVLKAGMDFREFSGG